MSEHAIEFLRGWIGEKVHCQHSPVKIEKQAETLAKECAAKAAEADQGNANPGKPAE